MRWLAAGVIVLAAGCSGSAPGDSTPVTPNQPPHGEFTAPEPTEAFLRALHTDQCALIDVALVEQLGWRLGSQAAQTLTACGAATADLGQSMSVELTVAGSERDAPASGGTCHRVRTIEQVSGLSARAVVTADRDPCSLAERFAATAAQRFAANAGAVEPPNPWIALDACELLQPALADSAAALGGPKPSSTGLRRIGLRGCLASHQNGTAEVNLTPASGVAAELDGDEIAIAGRKATVQQRAGSCVVLLVGEQLGGNGRRTETQVITVTAAAAGREPATLCDVARAMAETVTAALPA